MATPSAAQHRDLEERFRKIEAAVKALAAAVSKRPKFEVSAGDLTINGGDLVVDGGDFLLLDTDGSTVFRLGPQEHSDRGVSLYREDGTLALGVSKRYADSADQTLTVHDRFGNRLVAESAFGAGFDHPRLQIPMKPYSETPTPVTAGPYGLESPAITSDTFVPTHRGAFVRYNLFSDWVFRVKASDNTTAGEVRVVDRETGGVLNQFFQPPWTGVRAAGSTDYAEVSAVTPEGLILPGEVGELAEIEVQARRTAGTGSLTVVVDTAVGSGNVD